MANWINPKQDWPPQSLVTRFDLSRIEGNTAYLKEQVDDHQRQIEAIKNGEAVPNAVHAGTADNATNADTVDGCHSWQFQPANSDAGHSFTGNGYCKLPGGLIIQWGRNSYQGSSPVGFPMTFPSACLSVVATGEGTTASVNSITQTGFVLGTDPGKYARWIAIGY